MENILVPLGGGDNVGNSSYYVQLDGVKILFDAGGYKRAGRNLMPDFDYLLLNHLSSLSDLDAVVLSHAHLDHIGALPVLYEKTGNISYLSTATTKRLTYLQLVQFRKDCADNAIGRDFSVCAVENICEWPLLKKYKINQGKENEASITFFEAGHCPGDVMTLLETRRHKLVYTGDFMPDGKNSFILKQLEKPDILIMNATKGYAYPTTTSKDKIQNRIKILTNKRQRAVVYANNIAKYLEIFNVLNNSYADLKVAVDKSMTEIISALEEIGYPIYSEIVQPKSDSREEDILITAMPKHYKDNEIINGSRFSIHPSADVLYDFVKKIQPRETYIVHTSETDRTGTDIKNMLQAQLRTRATQCRNTYTYLIGGHRN